MKNVAVLILDKADVAWVNERLIDIYRGNSVRIHLINVQPAFSSHITQFFSSKEMEKRHHEDGMRVLQPVIEGLNRAAIPHWDHVLVGLEAANVIDFIKGHYCRDLILRDEPPTIFSRLNLDPARSRIRRALREHFSSGVNRLSADHP